MASRAGRPRSASAASSRKTITKALCSPRDAVHQWPGENLHAERLRCLDELRVYLATVDAIGRRPADLLEGPPNPDPGEMAMVKRPMECIMGAIEAVFEEFKRQAPLLERFVQLYYWSTVGPQRVADELAISRPTLKRYRLQVVTAVGSLLGWV